MAAAARGVAKARLLALVALVAALHGLVLVGIRAELAHSGVAPVGARPIVVRSAAMTSPQTIAADPAPRRDNGPNPEASRNARPAAIDSNPRKSASVRASAQPALTSTSVASSAAAPDEILPAPVATLDVPVYSTVVPASTDVRYELRRGARSGHGELSWRRDESRYEASLEGKLDGREALRWTSRGGVDGAGVAPERFTAQGRGRGTRAVNFQRDVGKITYSGPTVEHPLPAGAQDRLSWLVQLAAICAADPHRMTSGEQIILYVTGAGGEADIWVFVVAGADAVVTPGGSVDAVHLKREPRRPYDTRAEVWLEPARSWLPARLRLSYRDDGRDTLELTRID